MGRLLAVVVTLAAAGCLGSTEVHRDTDGTSAAAAAAGLGDTTSGAPASAAGGREGSGVRTMPPGEGPRPFAGEAPLALAFTIDTQSARPARAFEAFDTHALNLVDLDGDGRREIVSLNDNKRAYVLDGGTGRVVAELRTSRPGDDRWPARDINGVAVGDVTGDGRPELAVLNSAATLTLLALDRTASTREAFVFETLWERSVSATDLDPAFYDDRPWLERGEKGLAADGNPFIVHLPDGAPVILAQSDGYPAHLAFDADGTIRWHTAYWDGNSGPWAGRLRPSAAVSAVFATDGGHVVAYDVASGTVRWVFDARAHGATPGSIPIMPAVLDLRGDGNLSIFVGARVAVQDEGADWMQRSHARYFLLDPDGKVLWQASYPWGNPLIYADPAATDLNGDGVKDLLALDWNTIGHHPGSWNKTGPANLFAIDGSNGEALWQRAIDAQWSNTGLAVASFVGGAPGILTAEQRGAQDGLTFVALDGTRQGWMPLPPGWTVRRGPAVADLDGDGLAEVVVPVSRPASGCPQPLDVGCRAGALLVYRSQAAAGSVLFSGNLLFSDHPA